MQLKIEFSNLDKIQRAIMAAGKEGAFTAAKALRWEAQEAFANSQDEVPVDTSALKQSGRIVPEVGVTSIGREVFVTLTYGSTAADYAVVVHEDLQANHPHGKAKYLEDPMNRQVNGISDRIADRVLRAMRGELR